MVSHNDVSDIGADPFRERAGRAFGKHKQILGGYFRFESHSEALLQLVEAAFGDLPQHRLPVAATEFHIELRLVQRPRAMQTDEPAPLRMQSGAGLIAGVMDECNYVMLAPLQHRALVVVSEDMLNNAYHVRYEFIEFAVFVLAARGANLVPLHGACVGREGRGILLLGASGAGKSTLALHSLLRGLDFLAEDAVFVQAESMLATGLANYLHVQADALRFIDDEPARHWIAQAPVIHRRSGVAKFEVDLRRGPARLAATPLALVGAILVSNEPADDPDALLSPLAADEAAAQLVADQPYGAAQPGWPQFEQALLRLGVYRLRRGAHPQRSVDALEQLLG